MCAVKCANPVRPLVRLEEQCLFNKLLQRSEMFLVAALLLEPGPPLNRSHGHFYCIGGEARGGSGLVIWCAVLSPVVELAQVNK